MAIQAIIKAKKLNVRTGSGSQTIQVNTLSTDEQLVQARDVFATFKGVLDSARVIEEFSILDVIE